MEDGKSPPAWTMDEGTTRKKRKKGYPPFFKVIKNQASLPWALYFEEES